MRMVLFYEIQIFLRQMTFMLWEFTCSTSNICIFICLNNFVCFYNKVLLSVALSICCECVIRTYILCWTWILILTIHLECVYCSSGSEHESNLYYEIDLVTYVKEKELWDTDSEKKIEAASNKKEDGHACFKASKYAKASKCYAKPAKYIKYDTTFGEEEKKQANALKVTCNLNNASCKLKLKRIIRKQGSYVPRFWKLTLIMRKKIIGGLELISTLLIWIW